MTLVTKPRIFICSNAKVIAEIDRWMTKREKERKAEREIEPEMQIDRERERKIDRSIDTYIDKETERGRVRERDLFCQVSYVWYK